MLNSFLKNGLSTLHNQKELFEAHQTLCKDKTVAHLSSLFEEQKAFASTMIELNLAFANQINEQTQEDIKTLFPILEPSIESAKDLAYNTFGQIAQFLDSSPLKSTSPEENRTQDRSEEETSSQGQGQLREDKSTQDVHFEECPLDD